MSHHNSSSSSLHINIDNINNDNNKQNLHNPENDNSNLDNIENHNTIDDSNDNNLQNDNIIIDDNDNNDNNDDCYNDNDDYDNIIDNGENDNNQNLSNIENDNTIDDSNDNLQNDNIIIDDNDDYDNKIDNGDNDNNQNLGNIENDNTINDSNDNNDNLQNNNDSIDYNNDDKDFDINENLNNNKNDSNKNDKLEENINVELNNNNSPSSSSLDINTNTIDINLQELNNDNNEESIIIEKKKEDEEINKTSFELNASDNIIKDKCIPNHCWIRNIQDPVKQFSQFQVSYGQMVKLVGLGIRMNKYVSKTRKEGKEPFMDPFLSPNVTSSRGVPLGGIGCGSLSRSWNGDFNCFYLNPGRPTFGTVKANQFSLYIKRPDLPSQAFVMGNPFKNETNNKTKKEDSKIEMPPEEPLPFFITEKLQEHKIENDTETDNNDNIIDNNDNDLPSNTSQAREEIETVPTNTQQPKRTIKRTYIRPENALKDWNWKDIPGTYYGLFPRAWTTYDISKYDKRVKILCKQVSPVIPNNYKESSYPCSVFVWKITNTHPTKPVDISLMFTFQNGTGEVDDYTGGHFNQGFRSNLSEDSKFTGVELVHNNIKQCVEDNNIQQYRDPLSFGIATINANKLYNNGDIEEIKSQKSYASTFHTTGHGDRLWRSFSLTGKAILPETSASTSLDGIGIGSAVANKVTIEPNSSVEITFSLAWDQPIIRFGEGRGVHPRYTRFYGTSGHAVQKICEDALENWRFWDKCIDEWQTPILSNNTLPDWYKTALFNELYYIVAGGSLWIDQEESQDSREHHKLLSTKDNKIENIKPLQQDKENASKILDDFITLTQKIEKGIMINHQSNRSSGRIIFSPDEIEINIEYITQNGNIIRKLQNGTVKLADKITLYTSSEPGSPPLSPRQNNNNNNDNNNNENEESLYNDYGEYGLYLYLEGQEYLMYNTYDVHFYASFALISLWPELELNIQRNIAKSTLIHCPSDSQLMLHSNEVKPRKLGGAVPHDVGTPSGDPLYTVNSYCIHDVNCWKDLNSKFTLQVYRDYVKTKDLEFLKQVYPMVWQSMHYLERFDLNRDGMIENTGFPDQTYDTWTATGASAYCGGLWVAAVSAMIEMSKILEKHDDNEYYTTLLEKASNIYKTLWNGEYMKYDSSGKYDDIIMADQLAGQWYARASRLPPILDPDNIKTALKTVYINNVLNFHDGTLGAVNGYNKTSNSVDYTSMQSSEVWIGTTFALAANLYQEGLEEEAWKTAESLYNCIYNKFSYWYQTPEAWDEQGRYRSYAYMRPLAIWSIQYAIENKLNNNN